MSPKISVIVPIYNVAPYLPACLESVAAQTLEDVEVVMVDDGSTDASGPIAARFAERDPRFRLVTKANAGLGAARNTGIDHAGGDFLFFLDSDDLIPPYALEYLAAALAETGSDLATGNVRRFDATGVSRSRMHELVFRAAAARTHVTRDEILLTDRLVTNKLWRRSFWDAHRLRFPEGVLHEDIVVALTGHFLATAVDVLRAPVYLWRIRPDDDKSISQDRVAGTALEDRVTAVRAVGAFLAERGMLTQKRLWDRTALGNDLRLFLQELDAGDDGYRERFLDLANGFIDDAGADVVDELPAVERLKWHLVRRRCLPELLEVLTFQKSREMGGAGVARRGRHYYGRYPFFEDTRLAVPREIYRLREEIGLRQKVDSVGWRAGRLVIEGRATLNHLRPDRRWKQQMLAWLVCTQTGRRLPVPVSRVRTAPVGRAVRSEGRLDWGGYRLTVDPRRLTGRPGASWRLELWVINRGLLRRADLAGPVAGPAQRPAAYETEPGVWVCPEWTETGPLSLRLERHAARLTGQRVVADVLELTGEAAWDAVQGHAHLSLVRQPGGHPRRYPLTFTDESSKDLAVFTAHVPLADLATARPPFPAMSTEGQAIGDGTAWTVRAGQDTAPVRMAEAVRQARVVSGRREVVLHRTSQGTAELRERLVRPVVDAVDWSADGWLRLSGVLPVAADVPVSFVVAAKARAAEQVVEVERTGERFTAAFAPGSVPSLAGALPLAEGDYALRFRLGAEDGPYDVPVEVDPALSDLLPAGHEIDGRNFELGAAGDGTLVLGAGNDLRPGERGRHAQEAMRETRYPHARTEPLRPAVLFESYFGRQFSDSPRAILEELRRRDAPYEYLWIVDNGQAEVPEGVTAVRRGGREYFEALGHSAFIVSNSHLPMWFERRAGQRVLQTWHGATLKRIGFDIEKVRFATRDYHERLANEVAQWSYLVSPSPWCTPILKSAFRFEGEILETGYPRNDIFFAPERAALAERVRARIGLPPGKKVVLYAPTWRDDKFYRRGKYRLDLRLDLAEMWRRLGEEYVVMVRRHPNIVDRVPEVGEGFVFDVSMYPEMQELLLITDVLVTDYSSVMFDFAITGRPMLFFTYDLESYRDKLRGFYFDFEKTAPGPLLHTSGEVIEAVQSIDQITAEHAAAYEAFAEQYCPLDDGKATLRVVDRVFRS